MEATINNLFDYLLKTAICLAGFSIFQIFILRNIRHFQWQRFFILLSVLLSLIIPTLHIESTLPELGFAGDSLEFELIPSQDFSSSVNKIESSGENRSADFSFGILIALFYFTGSGFFLLKFSCNLFSIFRLIRSNRKSRYGDCFIVEVDRDFAVCSFLKFIITGRKFVDLSAREKKQIISHEQIHARQHHSLDRIFIELFHIFFWFNPLVWIIKNELADLHEFIADEEIAGRNREERRLYSVILLKMTLGGVRMNLGNSFNTKLTIRRIRMIHSEGRNHKSRIRFVLVLPLIAILTIMFSFNQVAGTEAKKAGSPIGTEMKTDQTDSQGKDAPAKKGIISMIPPVKNIEKVTISSGFGPRLDPKTGEKVMHLGIDIAAPLGTPVVASADGIVKKAEWREGYGNVVLIYHGKGTATLYSSLKEFIVKDGQEVKQGEMIGYIGTVPTGIGAHLHYELIMDGERVDPEKYLDLK